MQGFESVSDEGYDRTPEGRDIEALLRRHAPALGSGRQGAALVLAKLARRRREGVMRRLLIGASASAAAALIVALSILPDGRVTEPAQPQPAPAAPAPQVADAALTARIRGEAPGGWWIDRGLAHGLRVGDRLEDGSGRAATVAAVGIFSARVSATAAQPGTRLFLPVATPAVKRAAALQSLGGDPGGLYEFGAVLESLDGVSAREQGLSNRRALRVLEVFTAILRDPGQEPAPTLAGRLGLRTGDLILEVNGMPVHTLNQFTQALGPPGRASRISMKVVRTGRELGLTALAAE
jgi:hypothetical protein